MKTADAPHEAGALVLHHGALGDTIQLTAMLQALAIRWGGPCDLISGAPSAPALLANLEFAGGIHRIGSRSTPYFMSPGQRRLVSWLRQRPPSPVYVVERWRHRVAPWSDMTRFEWLLARAGIQSDAIVTTADWERGPIEHAVDYQLRMAARVPPAFASHPQCPLPESPPRPRLASTDDEVRECRDWLAASGWRGEQLVLFQTAARRSRKRGDWPGERWIALARTVLTEMPRAWVVLIGSRSERRRTLSLVRRAADPRVREVASDLPLRRLFALLRISHSMISLDTGPAHAAAALGCPLVVLAGTADPRRNRPFGDEAKVEVVTAFDGHEWPASGAEWFEQHKVEEIETIAVLDAWHRLGTV